jgi:peroxiredoxin
MNDTEVFGVSIDAPPSNNEFAKKLDLKFRLLSDMQREVIKLYGIYNERSTFARRTTFVVDKQGKIAYIEEGNSAVDPTNAMAMCLTLKEKEKAAPQQ